MDQTPTQTPAPEQAPSTATTPAASTPASAPPSTPSVNVNVTQPSAPAVEAAKPARSNGLLIVIIVMLVLVIAGGIWGAIAFKKTIQDQRQDFEQKTEQIQANVQDRADQFRDNHTNR